MQKDILSAEPMKYPPPTTGFRKSLLNFIQSVTFTKFIQLMMILNLVVCSLFYDDANHNVEQFIDFVTYFVTFIYLIEMILKIIVFGLRGYFAYHEHRFQCFISLNMLLNLLISYGFGKYFLSIVGGQKITRLLLILKVFGVLRIIGELPNVENILIVFLFSWKYILNIMVLLLSSYMIFAIIGCNLFPTVQTGDVVNEYVNFKNIFYGLMTLFKCATMDDWGAVMMDLYKLEPNCIPNVNCGSS